MRCIQNIPGRSLGNVTSARHRFRRCQCPLCRRSCDPGHWQTSPLPRACLQTGHACHCRLFPGPHMGLGLGAEAGSSRLVGDELQRHPAQKQEPPVAWRCSGPLGIVGEFCWGLYRGRQRPEHQVCLWEILSLHTTPSGRGSGL